MNRIHRVTVLGKEITVRGSADEQSVRRIESFADYKLQQVLSSSKTADTHLAVILAFLNLVEEHLALLDKLDRNVELENRVAQLVQRLKTVTG